MTIKDRVLVRLGRENGFISGEKLAADLGVSRTAVWKAIGELRDAGYSIEAAQKRGYRLAESPDFSAAALANELENRRNDEISATVLCNCAENPISPRFDELKPLVLNRTYSTNKVCRSIAAQAAETNERAEYVVLAAEQSAGRGRLGRSFVSPDGGLYMSFLLYPGLTAVDAQLITTTAAVAVCRAIEKLDNSLSPSIKWVNDIYLNGKKVCGILTEGQVDFETGTLAFAVLGIGVNIWKPAGGWAPEIDDRAGALFDSKTEIGNLTNGSDPRIRLASLISVEFYRLYPALELSSIVDYYRDRMFLTGMEVTVIPTGGEPYKATVVGVSDELQLIVRTGNCERFLSTGEVSLKL